MAIPIVENVPRADAVPGATRGARGAGDAAGGDGDGTALVDREERRGAAHHHGGRHGGCRPLLSTCRPVNYRILEYDRMR